MLASSHVAGDEVPVVHPVPTVYWWSMLQPYVPVLQEVSALADLQQDGEVNILMLF